VSLDCDDWLPEATRFLGVRFTMKGKDDDMVSSVGSMGSRGGVDKDEEREGKGGG
jgi:hypothetical protein